MTATLFCLVTLLFSFTQGGKCFKYVNLHVMLMFYLALHLMVCFLRGPAISFQWRDERFKGYFEHNTHQE